MKNHRRRHTTCEGVGLMKVFNWKKQKHSTSHQQIGRRCSILLLLPLFAISTAALQGAEVDQLWLKNCASCHGKDGKGKTPAGKKAGVVDFTKPEIQERSSDDKMFKSVKEGVKDGDKTKMKPAEKLTDTEIKKLIAYVRKFKP